MSRRALSLLETTVALFLLLVIVLLVVRLYHTALRYAMESERLVLATRFAEKVQARVKAWAADPDNFRSTWTSWSSVTDPDYPGMLARVERGEATLLSPCTSVETMFAPGERRLSRTVVSVRVSVRAGTRDVRLHTYLAEPRRTPDRIEVTRL
ncbi:MAG: hypothetical protein AB1758_36545, partial [Candidatus Eremiobacterota bacterium]